MTLSEAQKRASRKYEQKNPQRTVYMSMRRGARNFINPGTGTKSEQATQWRGVEDYKNDLIELKRLIDDKLKEL